MYSLADIGQPSIFFRIEDINIDVFDQIKLVSSNHLGVTQQHIDDFQMALRATKDTVSRFQFDQIQSLVK